jgi:phosphatidylglycerophosphate synthase
VGTETDVVGVVMVRGISLSDVVTITGYGLGLWWCSGGPGWAALASLGCDELDEAIARRMGTTSDSGAAMDWGADIALTPLAMLRLSRDLGKPEVAAVGAPVALAVQAKLKSSGARPPVLSARAVIMLAALALEERRRRLGLPARDNPTDSPRRPRKGRR